MKPNRTRCALLAAGFVALAGCAPDVTAPAATPRTPSHSAEAVVDGQYLVLFKGNDLPADFQAQAEAAGGTVTFTHAETGFAIVDGLDAAGAASIGALSSVAQVEADAAFSIDAPQASVEVEVEADEVAGDAVQVQSVANPATALRYSFQWNMRLINANAAWAAGKLGSPDVTVAILDSGLDYDIPDLNGLVDLSRSTSLMPADNALRATYVPTRHPVTDFNGHGTNVASQVSSKALVLAGVTSRTTLIGVKVLNRQGFGTVGSAMSGVLWAADHGANVANMSLGTLFSKVEAGPLLSFITRVLNYANRQGMLIVVAAPNHAKDLDHDGNLYNAYCNAVHVVCVSAVGPEVASANPDNVSFYTSFGRSAITVAAPGGNAAAANGLPYPLSAWPWGLGDRSLVWSYCPKNRIDFLTPAGVPVLTACAAGNRVSGHMGTSQAAAHVAGLAALLMAEYGTGNVGFIKSRLTSSAIDLGQTGTDPFYGRGRIDVAQALGL